MSKISDRVTALIKEPIEKLGYELVEVRFAKEYGTDTLTVFIDSLEDGGAVGLDDCERVSNTIDPILDEADPTFGAPYNLNVSSSGLDRPIKTDRDYKRNVGKEVEVKLYAPLSGTKTKVLYGVLEDKTGDDVRLRGSNGYLIELKTGQIALMTKWIKFD